MMTEHLRSIALNVLNKEVDNDQEEENCENYADLLNHLIKIKLYPVGVIATDILLPILEESFKEKNFKLLKRCLNVLNKIEVTICLNEKTEFLFLLLFDVLQKCRCRFLDFDRQKQDIVEEVVRIIEKSCCTNRSLYYSADAIKFEMYDSYVSFYIMKLLHEGSDNNLLKYINPSCSFENHTKTVTYLIGLLVSCVPQEWLSIFLYMCYECGIEEGGELFSDAVIYMCHMIQNLLKQGVNDEGNCLLSALKYCLQNYGITMKECVHLRLFSLEDDRITKHWRRLLRSIPIQELGCTDEVSLANLLFGVSS